jgi:O-antigen/teichoic acid export membrane protein
LLVGAVFPILTQAAHTNRPLFLKIVNAFLRHTILLIVPCAIVLSLCSSLVVRLMYGDPFLPAAPVFAVGAWAFAGVFINHLLLQMLVGVNRQNDFLFGALIACVVNAVASWLLFKEIGVVGGSWALVISETVLFSYCLFSFLRTVEAPRAILSELLKPAALALVAAIIGWFAGGIAALVVFVVGAFAFRLVDIASLRKMIS